MLVIPGQLELSKLAGAKNLKIFIAITIPASILAATAWYWAQFTKIPPQVYLVYLLIFTLFVLFIYQHFRYGTNGVISNCGVSYLSVVYLGLLTAFVPAIRIDFGIKPLLMFIFVIKACDIGAYVIGSMFGKHKFSPKISPKKTWEGMGGGTVLAIITAIAFSVIFDIMKWQMAAIFGFVFAFIGQLGDLAESMIKRDAARKDSANDVPGFGGILDVIDSPLLAAVFAYLFFRMCC